MSLPFEMSSDLHHLIACQEGERGNLQQLTQDIKAFLWATYDPNDKLIYPTIGHWDDLLTKTIESKNYGSLNKDEILSILFGLIHRDRVVQGLWRSMLERGVTQKLLMQLATVDTSEF